MQVPGIIQKTTIRDKRTLMTYVSATLFMFAYTILAYSIASFLMNRFPDNPNAILFVGVILGASSFFAIFIDSIWSYLQKIKTPRSLTLWALAGIMVTVLIFFLSSFGSFSALRWSLFTFVAAFLYGWSFDLYDITVTNAIIKTSDKKFMAQNISQKKVAEALGMVAGIILAGILTNIGASFTQFILLLFLAFVMIFFAKHFDKKEDAQEKLEFSPHALMDWKGVFQSLNQKEKVNEMVKNLPDETKDSINKLAQETEDALKALPNQTTEVLKEAKKQLVDILSKKGEIVIKKPEQKESFSFKTMTKEVSSDFSNFFRVFTPKYFCMPLFWVIVCTMLFSFWDTMVVTYQPLFLKEFAKDKPVINMLSGVLMILFISPVFALQIPFSKMADKIGRHKMILSGLLMSGVSVVMISTTTSIPVLIVCGMLGGAGYAAAFSPAQAMFLAEYNKSQGLAENADSEKGAGALRLVLNMGNIFGQILGGTVFSAFGFRGGFFVFGAIFLIIGIFSLVFYVKIRPRLKKEDSEAQFVARKDVNQAPVVKAEAQEAQQDLVSQKNTQEA